MRVITGVPGSEMAAYGGRLENDQIWRLVAYVRSASHRETQTVSGRAGAGEKIFWGKGGCGGCHRVGVKGGSIGPELNAADGPTK